MADYRTCNPVRILFDQGTPVPLRRQLLSHIIDTTFERGWSTLGNGQLLESAEQGGYDLLITTDQNLSYQQNLSGRQIAILVLGTTSWPRLRDHIATIQATVDAITPGAYIQLTFS